MPRLMVVGLRRRRWLRGRAAPVEEHGRDAGEARGGGCDAIWGGKEWRRRDQGGRWRWLGDPGRAVALAAGFEEGGGSGEGARRRGFPGGLVAAGRSWEGARGVGFRGRRAAAGSEDGGGMRGSGEQRLRLGKEEAPAEVWGRGGGEIWHSAGSGSREEVGIGAAGGVWFFFNRSGGFRDLMNE